MPIACKIYVSELEVRQELKELSLSVDLLGDVVKHIALTMNSHTEDHPSWGPGITTASEAVFALRNILKPSGWLREEDKGFALTVHPENRFAINLAKGDEGTGDADSEVLSVSDKGICTVNAIEKNQLSFNFPEPTSASVLPQSARPTWYLLYSRKLDGIHAELSLPMKLAETKQLSGWVKRIILPVTRVDGEASQTAGYDDGGFEVSIKRKSS